MNLKTLNINKNWTLFLDRDGVINKKLENDYVKHWIEFEFIDKVTDALKILTPLFNKIIVVTNQQGIGKGIYKHEDLELIHKNMLYEINYLQGKIDKVYYSPYLEKEQHPTRKPGIGMALQAKNDFPEINFKTSIIVGDSLSDMQFGKNAGMTTVFISETNNLSPLIDFQYNSLYDFSKSL